MNQEHTKSKNSSWDNLINQLSNAFSKFEVNNSAVNHDEQILPLSEIRKLDQINNKFHSFAKPIRVEFTRHAYKRLKERFPNENSAELLKKIENYLLDNFKDELFNFEEKKVRIKDQLLSHENFSVVLTKEYTWGYGVLVVKTVLAPDME